MWYFKCHYVNSKTVNGRQTHTPRERTQRTKRNVQKRKEWKERRRKTTEEAKLKPDYYSYCDIVMCLTDTLLDSSDLCK